MIIKSLIIAFSMYSRIYMPKIEWDERSMKYALCFFPLIGCVIGGIIYFIGNLLLQIKIGNILFASIMSIIPLAITGGIHFDGFLDTLDAINSYADKKKRLEILKDPNAGAFAVIGGLIYFTLSIGFWSEVHENMLLNISFSYILSRAFSGLSVVTFPFAKNNGLAVTFGKNADKIKVRVVMIIFIIVSTAFSLYINLIGGIINIITASICFIYHYYNCIKKFDGITGDLAGYFLQIYELLVVIINVILFGVLK